LTQTARRANVAGARTSTSIWPCLGLWSSREALLFNWRTFYHISRRVTIPSTRFRPPAFLTIP